MKGKVYLVGAGPGDPELLTLKALKILTSADVVLHDELVGPQILGLVPSSVQIINVGKRCGRKRASQDEINALLVQYALMGMSVARLKGGDPLIFGRGGEEIEALRQANIECEIVPGVTAALGAAAAAQIPLTHRQVSSALVFIAGHHAGHDADASWPETLPANATVVIYMPGFAYERTAQQLLRAGLQPTTPCAIVSRATSGEQQIHWTTVEELPRSPQLPAPTLLVVGEVVGLAKPRLRNQEFVNGVLASTAGDAVAAEITHFLRGGPHDGEEERAR